MRRALVVLEVALALVLLVDAGLLWRSLDRLFAVDPGFRSSAVLTMQIQASGRRLADAGATHRFFAQALEAAGRVPGVASDALTSQLPLSGDHDEYGAAFEDDQPDHGYPVFRYAVSPGYIETLGIPLRRGRLLDAQDEAGGPHVALISESLAVRKFGGADPIGRRLHLGPRDGPWFTIVGVVGDVKQASLAATQPDAVYILATQSWFADRALWLVARVRGDAAALAPAIRAAVWSVDKDQPIVRVATMESRLAGSGADRRFALVLFEIFAVVALVLAATGLYGVLAGSVVERTREIGIRSALGASRGEVVGLVVRQGLALTAAGAAIGLPGAAATTASIRTLLFAVSPADPLTYLGVVGLLFVTAAAACWTPAWRAARIDPSITLRAE